MFPIDTNNTWPVDVPIPTVPPADTNGWYPNPLVDPTETMSPPTGIEAAFASLVAVTIPDPVHDNWVPDGSESVKSAFDPGACRTPFISINALFVATPVIALPLLCVNAKSFVSPLNDWVKSSNR